MGKHSFVRSFLEERAAAQPTPDDWCYVARFDDPVRPRALRVPPGRALALKTDIARLVDELKLAIPAAFESEDYRNRRKTLETRFGERGEKAFAEVEKRPASTASPWCAPPSHRPRPYPRGRGDGAGRLPEAA